MARYFVKNLDSPDDVLDQARLRMQTVDLGDISVGWQVLQPGWRWSVDVRPLVGGEWCQTRHAGVQIGGRFRVVFADGTSVEVGPRDVYVFPPGHDGFVIGDEPVVALEWSGVRGWIPELELTERVLATLLLTDIVDSTATAARVGDSAWRVVLAAYNERTRELLTRYRGREVATTGDGFVATFDGAARAIRCAAELVRAATGEGLGIRASVHTGEVELVGDDVRGVAVHEAARMLEVSGGGEVIVSALTRELTGAAGIRFADRGEHRLRGIDGVRRLYAVTIDR